MMSLPQPSDASHRWRIIDVANATPELTFVIPCLNEELNVAAAIRAVGSEAKRLQRSHEVIVVDDGSRDLTVAAALTTIIEHPVRILVFSRRFGKEQAIAAGLRVARGRAAVVIDADLQEDIRSIELMLHHWKQGYDMVYGVRKNRRDETRLKRLGSAIFYWILDRTTTVSIPRNARDFRLMDRKVIDALNALPERHRFMKGLYAWVGFRTVELPIAMRPRQHGHSKFGGKRLLTLALTAITTFSRVPLRMWLGAGFAITSIALVCSAWIIVQTLLWNHAVSGWALVATLLALLGGAQLLAVGVLGEYVARIFDEVKGRPGYIVSQTIDYREHNLS